jgi:uncharacterized protein (TIGR02611 family)
VSTNPANHTSTAATTDDDPPAGTRERGRLYRRLHANPALALTTKIVVTVVGVLVMGTGIVMMVTPGPGIVGIVIGLAILASEYAWADRWLVKARQKAHEAKVKAEQMDPKVRRRRLLLAGLVLLVVVGAVAAYVTAYDWPVLAVDGWNWLQGVAGWMPELPGM